ncbi:uncharacterized protein C3orf84 homolog isoform X2 [Fukomys damarensis]|uniref:uncharacterized protein C3orf84 homolog isoform X2 n=1 Tax=Fukomys damarensis TaxID=885580 RepID=UPI00053FDB87|nr:uncharacterized protein C3orf84 homolog isoform X2 [Fukomys damarensis]
MESALVGSWHNSGFYGHSRGQVKSESAGEYRCAAKPQPPAAFLQRCQEPAQQHFFSKHDNRTSYDKGPYCLLQGIGRQKDLKRLWQRHTFLRWAPCELELSQQQPLQSSYQSDFQSGSGLDSLPQRLVHFVQIQPPYASTTYQQNFCHPSLGGRCGIDKIGPQVPVTDTLPDLPATPRPKLLQHYLHPGVSECLHWS